MTLYAQWSANTLTVTYNSNGGSAIVGVSTTVTGGSVTSPAGVTSRTGYTFDGWFDGDATNAVVFPYTHAKTADFTLTAHWTAIPNHTVVFNNNGGTGTMPDQVTNLPAALNANTFERAGYTFTGWRTAPATPNGNSFIDQATYSFATDITLYAQWVANSIVVTYNVDGGTAVSAAATTAGATLPTGPGATTKAGYTFDGWYDGGTLVTFPFTHGKTANFTLTTHWLIANATVTFNANDGTGLITSQTSNLPAALTANAGQITRDGYTFTGWTTAANGSGDSYLDGANYSFASSTTVYAQWSANTLTVTFDSNGGSAVAGATTVTGGTISAPNATTRAGYTFVGWFDGDAANAVVFPFTHGKTANFTLTAHWLIANATVTFNANDGTGLITSQTSNLPAALTANAGQITRDGYTFTGWTTAANGSGDSYLDGANYSFASSTTVYAQWSANTLTVTFDSNLGTEVNGVSTTVTGGTVSSAAGVTTRTDYTFDGWYDDETLVTFPYLHGKTADFVLVAHWSLAPANHTVLFNGNAVNTQGSMTAQTSNVSTALTANAFTRAGYTFGGWSLTSGGSLAYADSASYTFTSDVTLYAIWTEGPAINHTVLFNGNAVNTQGSMTAQTTNVSTALTANTFTRAGFSFGGWSLTADGALTYEDTASYNFTSDVTLYAIWVPGPAVNHTVLFNSNAADSQGSMTGQTANVASSLDVNAFTRAGFSFGGWSLTAGGALAYTNADTYDFTADVTLYAIWLAGPAVDHSVTYNSNSAESLGTMTPDVSNSAQSLTLNNFTLVGFTFLGWNTQADGLGTSYANGDSYDFTSDVTLYAQWSADDAPVYTVSFDGNGDDSASNTTQDSDVPADLTANTFTREGYTFAGWTTNADGTGMSYGDSDNYAFTADLFLFAKWVANTLTITYDPQGGTDVAGTTTVTGGVLTTQPGATTQVGKIFVGWYSTPVTGGVAINLPYTHGQKSDFTIYARWIDAAPADHTVFFNSGAADTLGSMTPQVANTLTTLTANGYTRAGYTFAGWATASGAGIAFTDSDYYSFASNVTLYAIWTENPAPSFTVTFNANSGTGSMSDQVANKTTVLSANAFSRTGYTFDGWAISAGGSVLYAAGVTYPFTADITLYAHWTQNYVPYVPPTPNPTPTTTTPVLSWSNPASIVVGTALSSVQLNALVSSPNGLAGTYAYTPAAGSLLAAGTYTLTVIFTPTDLVNYTSATKTVTLVVTPVGSTPNNPTGPSAATINIGDGNGTYDGVGHSAPVTISPANCTYTVTYNGSTVVPVNAGTYNVIVTAYGNCTGSATRTLVIAKATPTVDWADAADITTTTPLSSTQLNATANVAGRFAYSPAAKSTLPAGNQILGATFTPTDTANYESVNVTANIKVNAVILTQTIVSFFTLGSSTIPADQLSLISTASITPGQRITITGYAQPSNNAAADLKLGLARANAVKAQILKKNPKAKITVKTLGAKYQPLCAKALNKCVVIVLK